MNHSVKTRKLSRTRRGRTALLRGLAADLIVKGKIKTTSAKAKELRPFAERLVSYGKSGTVSARRLAATSLGEPRAQVMRKLFDELAPRFAERKGGYTRIIKLGLTKAGREESVIEFV
ncbi:50S ribosomal protein L17 [Candidatus Kaiserbacteria bacterium RIFOXYB1_FULL_46_14]|uniref:50S ribosomal protein L17 n=1 Tax=Candidatus Kaiserbacteria bacterium RIFOXYB1_FULL_46_14 TaxID=1798531 RepID=A0A1F6FJU2_9BACT|nr:MAG: 50S ribosomal protein L17 [Candidatus Kaiserbacteria bacterium RIFOXYB1_FULL_46_14]